MKRFVFPPKPAASRALLLAPLLPSATMFFLDATARAILHGPLAIVGAAMLAGYVLVVMEVFAAVVGGAVLALVWERIPFHVLIFSVLGGLIASLPLIGLMLLPQPNFDAWHGGKPTMVDGVKTAYGYWRDALAISQVFAFGAMGGAFFWWLCRPSKFQGGEHD